MRLVNVSRVPDSRTVYETTVTETSRSRDAITRAVAIARSVRTEMLGHADLPRDLAGQCGLAALRIAVGLGRPQVLRTGFFLKRTTFLGRRGRYPCQHAWCQVDGTIVDATATQFGRGLHAVHVAVAAEDDRYVEVASDNAAIDDILTNWCCHERSEYERLARSLRPHPPPSTETRKRRRAVAMKRARNANGTFQ